MITMVTMATPATLLSREPMVRARWARRSWSSALKAGATQRKWGFLNSVVPLATRLVILMMMKLARSHTMVTVPIVMAIPATSMVGTSTVPTVVRGMVMYIEGSSPGGWPDSAWAVRRAPKAL